MGDHAAAKKGLKQSSLEMIEAWIRSCEEFLKGGLHDSLDVGQVDRVYWARSVCVCEVCEELSYIGHERGSYSCACAWGEYSLQVCKYSMCMQAM